MIVNVTGPVSYTVRLSDGHHIKHHVDHLILLLLIKLQIQKSLMSTCQFILQLLLQILLGQEVQSNLTYQVDRPELKLLQTG